MAQIAIRESLDSSIADSEVVRRVLAGETELFEIIMRRYNQRLYRATRAILGDEVESEQVMQDAYVLAYTHLAQFAEKAQFSTWLTKIAVNEALGHLRRRLRFVDIDSFAEEVLKIALPWSAASDHLAWQRTHRFHRRIRVRP
jgi:RNA polymerase sigma-70 factor, ECF subfamily